MDDPIIGKIEQLTISPADDFPFLHKHLIRESSTVDISTEGRRGLDILEDWVNHQLKRNEKPWLHIHDLLKTIEAIKKEVPYQ